MKLLCISVKTIEGFLLILLLSETLVVLALCYLANLPLLANAKTAPTDKISQKP